MRKEGEEHFLNNSQPKLDFKKSTKKKEKTKNYKKNKKARKEKTRKKNPHPLLPSRLGL